MSHCVISFSYHYFNAFGILSDDHHTTQAKKKKTRHLLSTTPCLRQLDKPLIHRKVYLVRSQDRPSYVNLRADADPHSPITDTFWAIPNTYNLLAATIAQTKHNTTVMDLIWISITLGPLSNAQMERSKFRVSQKAFLPHSYFNLSFFANVNLYFFLATLAKGTTKISPTNIT